MNSAEHVAALREKVRLLYEGKQVAHRSCGIALAETFAVPTRAYQALRKGGLTGLGPCGAVHAGRLILGELLGDPDPTGAVTPALRQAMARYDDEIARRLGSGGRASCDALISHFPEFTSPERIAFCTGLETTVAEVLAETLLGAGVPLPAPTIPAR